MDWRHRKPNERTGDLQRCSFVQMGGARAALGWRMAKESRPPSQVRWIEAGRPIRAGGWDGPPEVLIAVYGRSTELLGVIARGGAAKAASRLIRPVGGGGEICSPLNKRYTNLLL